MFKKIIITIVAINMLLVGVVSAQGNPSDDTSPPFRDGMRERAGQFDGALIDGEIITLVESYTGMEPRDIMTALRQDDRTLAQLIEANGQSADAFISDAVSSIENKIDEAVANDNLDADRAEQMKANLTERVTDMVNGEFAPRRVVDAARRLIDGEIITLVESYTGMEPEAIRTAIREDDSTLAQLIEANGQSADAFISDAVNSIENKIDEAVANNNLDADRAEQMKANLTENITDIVNGERLRRSN